MRFCLYAVWVFCVDASFEDQIGDSDIAWNAAGTRRLHGHVETGIQCILHADDHADDHGGVAGGVLSGADHDHRVAGHIEVDSRPAPFADVDGPDSKLRLRTTNQSGFAF